MSEILTKIAINLFGTYYIMKRINCALRVNMTRDTDV